MLLKYHSHLKWLILVVSIEGEISIFYISYHKSFITVHCSAKTLVDNLFKHGMNIICANCQTIISTHVK